MTLCLSEQRHQNLAEGGLSDAGVVPGWCGQESELQLSGDHFPQAGKLGVPCFRREPLQEVTAWLTISKVVSEVSIEISVVSATADESLVTRKLEGVKVEIRRHLLRKMRDVRRHVDGFLVPQRVRRKMRLGVAAHRSAAFSPAAIPVHFINLSSRQDRREQTENELRSVGFRNVFRFEAIQDNNGALGCALSHARLMGSLELDTPAIMVCEDDVEFLCSPEELQAVLAEFLENVALDVLCLAYNTRDKPKVLSARLAVTVDTATASCYVVKATAINNLEKSFQESAQMIQEGCPIGISAIDQHWKKLQRTNLLFAIPRSRMARQRASYSDIEGHDVFYGV